MVPKIQVVKVETTEKSPFKYGNQRFFSFFQYGRLVFLESLGVQRRYVPHFKGLISGDLEPTAQGRGRTVTLRYAL